MRRIEKRAVQRTEKKRRKRKGTKKDWSKVKTNKTKRLTNLLGVLGRPSKQQKDTIANHTKATKQKS